MGPEGSPCTPLRALREWCYIVPWTPLIKNQEVNNRYFGSHPPLWTVFKMAALKNGKIPIEVNISPISSFRLDFFSRTTIFKILNSISDIKN